MLSEQFLTSVESSGKAPNSAISKDVGIHLHNFKPSYAVKSGFKKSSTPPNCLALSSTHIYAAQSEKAVVHVYSRAKGNQEAVVPFAERIHVAKFVGDNGGAGVLALGTAGGRVILWEVHTGRQVTTPPSHLQEVTSLAVDPTNGFLLSGSADSKIHVWSTLALLSFATPPKDYGNPSASSLLRTFSGHRSGVTGVCTGHSTSQTNIAVSTSKSGDCLVWDYHTGDVLRTFILSGTPTSLAVDPCDRACYVGFEDGSIQLINFFKTSSSSLDEDSSLVSTPLQPPVADHWSLPSESGPTPTLCVAVVYEGNFVLSGHTDGQVRVWDVATHSCSTLTILEAPVTNLLALPLSGLEPKSPSLKVDQVTKPRYESSLSNSKPSGNTSGTSAVPYGYSINAQLPSTLSLDLFQESIKDRSPVHQAFTQPGLPPSLLVYPSGDSSAAATMGESIGQPEQENENIHLRSTITKLEEKHSALWQKMVEIRAEKIRLEKSANKRAKNENATSASRKKNQGKLDSANGKRNRDRTNGASESEASSDLAWSSSSIDEGSSVKLTSDEEDSDEDLKPAKKSINGLTQEAAKSSEDEVMAE
ncbi:MAG: hypothetical protein M4579_003162 [Chaenotheca gracillima]|nr:MAG: hypothetical protein M4579_003162 [Chaenotheca gracillima]